MDKVVDLNQQIAFGMSLVFRWNLTIWTAEVQVKSPWIAPFELEILIAGQ